MSMIGFKAWINVDFWRPELVHDSVNGGFLVDVNMNITGYGYADQETFKGYRLPIAAINIMPPVIGPTPSRIRLGFYPSPSDARIFTKGTVVETRLDNLTVVVVSGGNLAGTVGALLNFMLGALISVRLSRELTKKVSAYLARKEWRLLDAETIGRPGQAFYLGSFNDVSTESLLTSIADDG